MKRFQFLNQDMGGGGGGGSILSAGDAAPVAGAPAAGAPATSWAWAKEDGTLAEDWTSKLPDEIKGEASLGIIKTLPDLAKSYLATKKMVGTKLEAPGEKSTPEQIAQWKKTVGAPETVEGYLSGDIKTMRPESVPAELWDAGAEKEFLAVAHKHHLPPDAVKDILEHYGKSVLNGLQQSQAGAAASITEETQKLRSEWGQQFDTNLNLAKRVAQTAGLELTDPIFQSSAAVAAFAKLGKLFSEDRLVKGDAPGITGAIGERIQDISDPKSQSTAAREYRGEFGAERQAAVQKQLHELMAAQNQK